MNPELLNVLTVTAGSLIIYYAARYAIIWWRRKRADMESFSREMEALEIRTAEAREIAQHMTPDRPKRTYFTINWIEGHPQLVDKFQIDRDIDNILIEVENEFEA